MPDHNEAMRLADEVRVVADRLQYTPGGFYGVETVGPLNQAAALLRQLSAERDQLRAEVERMDFIEKEFGDVLLLELAKDLPRADMPFREAIDAARTTHKETE